MKLQVNPIGIKSTDDGYITSIVVVVGGTARTYTPSATLDGSNVLTAGGVIETAGDTTVLSAAAGARLVGGANMIGANRGQGFSIVQG